MVSSPVQVCCGEHVGAQARHAAATGAGASISCPACILAVGPNLCKEARLAALPAQHSMHAARSTHVLSHMRLLSSPSADADARGCLPAGTQLRAHGLSS